MARQGLMIAERYADGKSSEPELEDARVRRFCKVLFNPDGIIG